MRPDAEGVLHRAGGCATGPLAAPKHILMVISNPATSTTLGIPVGFWGAELTHAYHEFTEVGYKVTIASPNGGPCRLDAWSDPRDSSKYS